MADAGFETQTYESGVARYNHVTKCSLRFMCNVNPTILLCSLPLLLVHHFQAATPTGRA